VLPLVGSTTVPPGASRPSAARASSIATPMRSLTECVGLKNSSLREISACTPASAASRDRRTSGVPPIAR
jgi:hypothetical protein